MNVRILDTSIPSVEIHIRSDDYKFKFSNNDFLFQMHDSITNPNENEYYMSAELTTGEFPVSFFNISEKNNRFDFFYEGTEHSCILTIGNYNMNQLLSHFSSKMTSYAFINPINLSWNASNNRVSLISKRIGSLSIRETSTCLSLIGFTKKQHDADNKVLVTEANNTILYEFLRTLVNITIPVGKYTAQELATQVTTQLHGQGHTEILNLNWDAPNYQYYFSHAGTIPQDNRLILRNATTAWGLLGLSTSQTHPQYVYVSNNVGYYEIRSTSSPAISAEDSTLGSDTMCDIRVYTSLFIHTDLFSNGLSAVTQEDNNSKNILARVPVTAGTYQTILYNPFYPHNVPLPKKSFKTFRISIRDDEGKIVDMNLMKWTATISIRFHKKNSLATDYQSSKLFKGSFSNSSYISGGSTTHTLINYIKDITEEYKNGNLDYSRLTIN